MYAGLFDPKIDRIIGNDALRSWADVFGDDITDLAVQPRAHLCGSLEWLQKQVRHGEWNYR